MYQFVFMRVSTTHKGVVAAELVSSPIPVALKNDPSAAPAATTSSSKTKN